MNRCVLNNKTNKVIKPKWVVIGEKLRPAEFIEWMHITKSYRNHKRVKYSKNFNIFRIKHQ